MKSMLKLLSILLLISSINLKYTKAQGTATGVISYTETVTLEADKTQFNTNPDVVFTFSNDQYFLYVRAWIEEIIDGKTVQIQNGIYDLSKSSSGFSIKLKNPGGKLSYYAVEAAQTPIGSSTPYSQSFTATQGQTNFTLDNAPSAAWVWLNGLLQFSGEWSINESDIAFNNGVTLDDQIDVYYITDMGAVGEEEEPQTAIQASDEAYAASWEGNTDAATKNVLYDKFEEVMANIGQQVTQTISYSASPSHDYTNGNSAIIILSGDVTSYGLSNVPDGAGGEIAIIQDATGGYGINAVSHTGLNVQFLGGAPETANINSGVNEHTLISYKRLGAYLYVSTGGSGSTDGGTTPPDDPTTQSTLTNGMLAYYGMNEASGTDMLDSSGNDQHGTINSVLLNQTGMHDKAYDFSNDGKATLPFNTSFTNLSFSCWIKLNTTGGYKRILDKNSTISAWIEDESILYSRYYSGDDGKWVTPAGSITTGVWHHIVFTHDGTINAPVIYIDNIQQSLTETNTPTGTVNSNSDNYYIGNHASMDRNIDGLIDEAILWDRIITDDEITELYNSGSGKAYPFNN